MTDKEKLGQTGPHEGLAYPLALLGIHRAAKIFALETGVTVAQDGQTRVMTEVPLGRLLDIDPAAVETLNCGGPLAVVYILPQETVSVQADLIQEPETTMCIVPQRPGGDYSVVTYFVSPESGHSAADIAQTMLEREVSDVDQLLIAAGAFDDLDSVTGDHLHQFSGFVMRDGITGARADALATLLLALYNPEIPVENP